MATCVDVASASYPAQGDAIPIRPLEGQSLRAAFENRSMQRQIFWEHEGNRALRDGKWKLVAKGKMQDRTTPVKWELFDIASDRSEMHDPVCAVSRTIAANDRNVACDCPSDGCFPKPQTQTKATAKEPTK